MLLVGGWGWRLFGSLQHMIQLNIISDVPLLRYFKINIQKVKAQTQEIWWILQPYLQIAA